MTTRLFLIADDHEIIRMGLKQQLQTLGHDVSVLESFDYASTLSILESVGHRLDCLLLDLSMPGGGRFDLLKTVSMRYPSLSIIVISSSEDPCDLDMAINSGAVGYIPKSLAATNIINAIQLVMAGGVFMPKLEPKINEPSSPPSVNTGLTKRQRQVLSLMGRGYGNKDIADQLEISPNTVKIHVTAILRELEADNRTQAILAAKDKKLIE